MELRIQLDESHQHVEVEFWVKDALVGQVRLAAPDLDEHLRTMAALRAQMTDEVPETLEPNARLLTERDPKWVLGRNPTQDRFLLALRHAGLGWLGFSIPGSEARAIAELVGKSGSESSE
jgi:hypothetical protein